MTGDNEKIVSLIQNRQGEERNELLTKLWTKNRSLIQILIRKMTGLDPKVDTRDFEDMEQQAFIGLMFAIPAYSPDLGIRFFSFADKYIRKSLYRYYDCVGQALRIPEYMRIRMMKYLKIRNELKAAGMDASPERIKEKMRLSQDAFDALLSALLGVEAESLDQPLDDYSDETVTMKDIIAGEYDTERECIESVYLNELHDTLQEALSYLPENDRRMVVMRYYQGLSDRQISDLIGCTQQNVSQRIKYSFWRIRHSKHAKELLEFLPEGVIQVSIVRMRTETQVVI